MFEFANPEVFLLLLPLGAACWFVYRRRRRSALLFSATQRVPPGTSTWRTTCAALLPALVLLGLLLAVVAMARPRTFLARVRNTAEAIAIEMVVDVSGSMEALDMSERTATGVREQTRLDVVKEVFGNFVEKRPDDLIGLITFGGYAVTRAPLTTDKQALLHVLRGVEIPTEVFDRTGNIVNREELMTAIGDALATACARLRDAEPTSRIIVLLSDGESNTGLVEPKEAIRIAEELGIRVYTIGIGTTGRAPFRRRDAFGRPDIRYAQVTLDEALLRKVAEETGGRYFNVRDPDGLEKAMADINDLEKTEIDQDEFRRYRELFARFLLPGLLLILLGTGFNMLVSRRLL